MAAFAQQWLLSSGRWENGGIVMDGRDIGTVVFPHAQLKASLLTASVKERARRRFEELKVKGETVSLEDLKRESVSGIV